MIHRSTASSTRRAFLSIGQAVSDFIRPARTVEFWLSAVVCFCAIAGTPWLVAIPLGVLGLMLCVWPKYAAMLPRARAVGAEREFAVTVALSILNALITISASYLMGLFIRWLFW